MNFVYLYLMITQESYHFLVQFNKNNSSKEKALNMARYFFVNLHSKSYDY